MLKILPWLCLLLSLPSLAQRPPALKLETVLGTPIYSPSDVAVDARGYMYLLEDDEFVGSKPVLITKLDPQGRFVERINVSKPNYVRPYNCNGSSLALDATGNLYIADNGAGEVRKFSPTGQLLLTFHDSQWRTCSYFNNPTNLTVDAAGGVFVVDDQQVQKFNALGTRQWTYRLPITPRPGYPDARLLDVAADATGSVYVVDSETTISKLSATGQLLSSVNVQQAGNHILTGNHISSLVLDPAGNFYVGLSGGSPVYEFSPAGAFIRSFGPDISSGKLALAFDAQGNLYASTAGNLGFGAILHKFDPTGRELTRWGGRTEYLYLTQTREGDYYTYNWTAQQVIKCTVDGQELLRFGQTGGGDGQFEQNNGWGDRVAGLAVDGGGNVYTAENTSFNGGRIQKFDSQGRFQTVVWNRAVSAAHLSSIAVDPAGNIYVSDTQTNQVLKLNPQGQLLLTLGRAGLATAPFSKPQALATDELGMVYVADSTGIRIRKFSPRGQYLRQTVLPQRLGSFSYGVNPAALSVDRQGALYVSHSEWDSVRTVDRSGQFHRALANPFGSVAGVSINREGTRLLTLHSSPEVVCAYTSASVGALPQSRIRGRVFQDLNRDCVVQANEPGLAGIAVVAEPGAYYGLSDENGEYSVVVDTGTYVVQPLLAQEPGRLLQPTCGLAFPVRVAVPGTTVTGPDLGLEVSISAHLTVSVTSNRRRRCFRNTTTVGYANTGFAPAGNAQVKVSLPQYVEFISANVPHTRDPQGNYLFAVGTLAPNASGTILIQDSVECGNPDLRGLTVCTQATITPANAYPMVPVWNRASMVVQGTAQPGNRVRFVVRNSGAVMTDSLALRIYQNSELALQHRYQLAAGDSLVLRVPASRPVVRVEADQPAGHPTQRVASATVEVRVLGTPGRANPDMLAMPPNAPEPARAEDCQPIIDSYDPNDKQVTPTGVTAQHYTPTGAPLRYQVRFQNTGTDDAYRVEVVDTLAVDLDLRTLRMTMASHPYRLAVTGHGRPVLTFTFDNVNLPPSTRDEASSQGLVQFSIQPKAGLPARALIENAADIYFDFNPPVRTNTTANRIYDLPLVVAPAVALTYAAVIASPHLAQFAPAQGRAGTLITLTGERFAFTVAGNTVRFNGVAAPVLGATSTMLIVRVPATATTGTLEVATAEGAGRSTAAFTVYQPPTLLVVAPAEAVPGSPVILTGTHFSAVSAQDTVWFNGTAALVQQASPTALQVVVPTGATSGRIRIRTLGGLVESTQPFVVWYPPMVTSVSPRRGKAGDVITLAGSNFATDGRSEVALGGGAAVLVQAQTTSLRVRVPASAQSGAVRVTTPGGTALSATPFTFLPAPRITAFAPTQASVGEVLTLTGENFLVDAQPDTVYIGGVRAAVLAATATSATVRVPMGARSGPIIVSGTGGQGASAMAFVRLELTAAEAIAVYPNPARGVVILDWHRADFALEQAQVYNALGSLISSVDLRQHSGATLPLQLTDRTGLYVVVIQTSQGPVIKRFTLY